MTTPWRVLLADDHAIFRDGLRCLLEPEPDLCIAGEAADTSTAIQFAQELQPEIILLDQSMPSSSGVEAIEPLIKVAPKAKIILLTAGIAKQQVARSMQFGARGIVLKESTSSTLLQGIRLVMAGQYWIASECVNYLVDALRDATAPIPPARPKDFGLTRREMEIVNLVAAAYSNPDIAKKCAISEQTVKHHISNIFDKVGVYNRVELALFAVSHQIVGDVPL